MNTDRSHDASAYLDGASTPAERAAVEADPVTLGEVERFRALRDELATPRPEGEDPAGAVARELAVTAALQAFDELHATAAAAAAGTRAASTAPRPLPTPARRGLPVWLGAAAAAVLVVAAGALVVGRDLGGNQDDSTSDVATFAVTDEAGTDREARSTPAAELAEGGDAVAAEEIAPMAAADEAPAEDATGGAETAADTDTGGGALPGTEAPGALTTLGGSPESAAPVELTGPAALASYATEVAARWRDAGTWPPPVEDPRCIGSADAPATAVSLGEVHYATSTDAPFTPALVLVDPALSRVVALDATTCALLVDTVP
jgi:hypothetical protein